MCYLVECSSSSKNNMRVVHLNGSLPEPHQIGPDSYGSACDLQDKTITLRLRNTCKVTKMHQFFVSSKITQVYSSEAKREAACTQVCPLQSHQVHGDDLLVSQRGFSGNHSRPFQILHTQPFVFSYDVGDLVPAWRHIYSLKARRGPPTGFSFHCHPLL